MEADINSTGMGRFNYMSIGDNRKRKMPLPDDRSPERSQPLAYPEAVHLTKPIEDEFRGEVCYLCYLFFYYFF